MKRKQQKVFFCLTGLGELVALVSHCLNQPLGGVGWGWSSHGVDWASNYIHQMPQRHQGRIGMEHQKERLVGLGYGFIGLS